MAWLTRVHCPEIVDIFFVRLLGSVSRAHPCLWYASLAACCVVLQLGGYPGCVDAPRDAGREALGLGEVGV